MSQFYDQASLVMVPSGYKAGKVYSQKPLSTDGELTFTRNSNATRVNADGLVEKVRTNLITYSNDFSSAAWSLAGPTTPTATSGQADKDGGTDAWLINWGTTQSTSFIYQNITSLTISHTASCWVKGTAGLKIKFGYGANVGQGEIITFTGEWQRVSHTSSSGNLFFFSNYITGFASSFYVQYVQHEVSDFGPTDYIPTTSAAVSVGPTANVPRLDYSGGACPSLLLEPQRTNIFTFSEQANDSAWFKTNLSVTANYAVSPDGYQNADLLDDGTASSTQHWIYQAPTFSNSTAYTISLYAKYVSRKYMTINIYNGSTSQFVAYDIQNGTIYGSTGDVTATITSAGNGWYRLTYTRTTAATGSPNFRITLADDTGSQTYTGSNKQTLVWGFQCEAGSYATSLIPTLGASVTRLADAAYKTGISSLIGQTEGTMFAEYDFDATKSNDGGSDNDIINLKNSANSDFIKIVHYGDGPNSYNKKVYFYTRYSSVYEVNISSGVQTSGRMKVAAAYKANDFVLYVNGVQIGTDTSGSVATCDTLYLSKDSGTVQVVNPRYQALLFKTRLTNAQLAELTTL